MSKNTGSENRIGAVKERVQALNPVTKRYVQIDTSTGRIIDRKKTAGPAIPRPSTKRWRRW